MNANASSAPLSVFAAFVPKQRKGPQRAAVTQKTAVIYTRVSTKEQADTNLSLDVQRKIILEYAERNGFRILEAFGGTYESAKTDGRKEFNRMLEAVRKSKGAISHILVYMLDRFSRSGGAAIQLATELREKYGVTVLAVTQPMDTQTPTGQFSQAVQLLASNLENAHRRQRAIEGTKEKLERGIWCARPPLGYDRIRKDGAVKIVVNATGRKLRKAFEWKAEGMKNEEILEKLRCMGIKMYKQKLSQILNNPFYCGVLVHKTLEGRVIEGIHEKLISWNLFFQINNIHTQQGNYGVPHRKERGECH